MTKGRPEHLVTPSSMQSLVDQAKQIMPGGVSSPVRAALQADGSPFVAKQGQGAFLEDHQGDRFVDLQMAFGPLLLGHAHPLVVERVQQAAARGLHHGALVEDEVRLARRLVLDHPALERVRFVNSGTEAVMSALRLARAATGRTRIVKFEGGYHGHSDALLSRAGSGVAALGLPDSAGVCPAAAAHTTTLALDDEEALEIHFAARGDETAAVLVEGIPANHGLLPQRKSWHERLRQLTRDHGALLIVDEVISGTRMAWGGASERYGLEPDIVTLGKVIGGGLPVGAYGGRRKLMEMVAPLGPVYQAGTLSGNPLAMAAGLATLEAFREIPDAHRLLDTRTRYFARAVDEMAQDAGADVSIRHEGSLVWIAPDKAEGRRRPVNFTKRALHRFRDLHEALKKAGVWCPPSPYEVCFLSTAHDEEVIERTLAAFHMAVRRVARRDA